jgi:hypothetical protein
MEKKFNFNITPKKVLTSIGKLALYSVIGINLGNYLQPTIDAHIAERSDADLDSKSEPYRIEKSTHDDNLNNSLKQNRMIAENIKQINSSDNFVPIVLFKDGSAFCSGTEFTSKKNFEKYVLGIEHCFDSNDFYNELHKFRISNTNLGDSAVVIPKKVLRSSGIYAEQAVQYLERKNYIESKKIDIPNELKNFRASNIKACGNFSSKPKLTSINKNYAKQTSSEYRLWKGGSSGAGLFSKDENGEDCFYGVLKGFIISDNERIKKEIDQGTFKDETVNVNYSFVSPNKHPNSEWIHQQTGLTARPTKSTIDTKK